MATPDFVLALRAHMGRAGLDPRPADGEMTELAWYTLESLDAVPDIDPDMRERIRRALSEGAADFVGGR